jgi:hypothetical protein
MKSSDPKQAVEGAIALSKSLGVDLNSAIKMSTLAMEGDYNMLKRYVPALKATSDEGKQAAIVQKLFADGMKIAHAEAKTGLGPMIQLKNSWGDLQEKMGAVLIKVITPMAKALGRLVTWLDNMDESTREWVVGIGLVVAAIGPVVFIIGKIIAVMGALTKTMGVLNAVMAANPISIIIIAIAALVGGIVYLINKVGGLSNAWEIMKTTAVAAYKTINVYSNALFKTTSIIFKALAKVMLAPYRALWAAIEDKNGKRAMQILKDSIVDPSEDIAKVWKDGTKTVNGYWKEVGELTSKMWNQTNAAKAAKKAQEEFNATTTTTTQPAQSSGRGGTGKRNDTKIEKVQTKGIETPVALLGDPEEFENVTASISSSYFAFYQKMRTTAEAFNERIVPLIEGGLQALADSFATGVANMINGGGTMQDLMAGLLFTIADFGKRLGQLLIAVGMAQLGLESALETMNPYLAIGAGVALMIAAAVAKNYISSGMTNSYATGTTFAAGGMALVGERGPEMVNLPRGSRVTPNYMMGGSSQVEVVGIISGNDIRIANKRSGRNHNRW